MSRFPEPVHVAVRQSRRVRGVWQTRQPLGADGIMPEAVERGIRTALGGLRDPAETQWVRRIEAMRELLLLSPAEFDTTDFGAGPRSATGAPRTRTVGQMTRSSKPRRWAELLFSLVRATRVTSLLELGSCVGISAAYQSAALELNGGGRLISLEGVKALASRSEQTLDELGLLGRGEVRLGEFGQTLPEALKDLTPIDYAFIDGNHREDATLAYANQLYPNLADEALLVFDDINWSEGMARAWQGIVADPRYALTVDLRSVGLAVVSASAHRRVSAQVSYY